MDALLCCNFNRLAINCYVRSIFFFPNRIEWRIALSVFLLVVVVLLRSLILRLCPTLSSFDDEAEISLSHKFFARLMRLFSSSSSDADYLYLCLQPGAVENTRAMERLGMHLTDDDDCGCSMAEIRSLIMLSVLYSSLRLAPCVARCLPLAARQADRQVDRSHRSLA